MSKIKYLGLSLLLSALSAVAAAEGDTSFFREVREAASWTAEKGYDGAVAAWGAYERAFAAFLQAWADDNAAFKLELDAAFAAAVASSAEDDPMYEKKAVLVFE